MKSGSVKWINLALATVALSFGAGCEGGAVSSEQAPVSSNLVAATSIVATNADAVTNLIGMDGAVIASPDPEVPDIATAEVSPIMTEKPLPATIRSNSPVVDIMKLVESGVDESVLLAFITNSTSTFNLTADDIIYLTDIGIPGTFVTAILEHDKALRAADANVWSAQTPALAETSNPAPPPAPQDMAPQVAEQAAPPQEAAAPPPSQVTYNNFYSALSPYGTWVEVEGYGRCWQPTAVVANPSWQPYMNSGRWAYTDYGWYWASDYSWGWAPFHYGRWFQHSRIGWCWYPDTVWGPSWVSWRYNSSYCGWAPLPPSAWYSPAVGLTYWGSHVGVSFSFGLSAGSYSFVSWNNFHGHHSYNRHAVPHGHRQRIYNETVVATRISGNRNNVFNHGITPQHVERATGTRVNRVAVHEVSTPRGRGVRPDRLASDGRSLTAYRPRLAEGTREMPAAVRDRAQRSAGGTVAAGGSASRPSPENRVTPAASAAGSDGAGARVARTQVARNETVPQRPVSAASLARPTGSVPSAQRPDSATPVARAETPVLASPANVRDGRSTVPAPRREVSTPATMATRPQQNPVASVGQQTSRPVQRVEPGRSTTQRPQASSPNRQVSQPAAPVYRAPQPQTPQVPRYAPNPSYQQPSRAVSETPRYTSPPRTETPRAAPTPRTETPRPSASAPSYQAPVRSYTPPAPSYQAPRTAAPEAPRYSPPARQREAPAQSPQVSAPPRASQPSYSAPAPSGSRNSSSPNNNSGRQQPR